MRSARVCAVSIVESTKENVDALFEGVMIKVE